MSDPTPEPTPETASEPTPERTPEQTASEQTPSEQTGTPEATSPRPTLTRRRLFAFGGALVAVGGAVWLGSRALGGGAAASPSGSSSGTASSGTFLSADRVHTVSLTAQSDALAAALAAYRKSEEKTWLEATLTIDGVQHDRVGVRLKGNSSLKTLLAGNSTDPGMEELPWLVRLDKYVSKQNHDGLREFVIRSSSTTTALNEAVALDLLEASGLASQKAAYLRLSANGSAEKLRLAIENPGEDWAARVFDGEGILYKADASGDYTYRGTDASAYDDVFDVEAGDDNLQPLTSFLDFINNASDTDFSGQLANRLEVDAFATYLAFETVIDNFDDIDGPGNNSMLWWAKATTRMTVVAWDHNLAFGSSPGMGGNRGAGGGQLPGGGQMPGGGQAPSGMPTPGAMPSGQMPQMPEGMPTAIPTQGQQPGGQQGGQQGAQRGQGGGMQGKSNALVNRFTALHQAKIDEEKTRLKKQFFTDGAAKTSLERWAGLVSASASDLIDSATLASERKTIETYFV